MSSGPREIVTPFRPIPLDVPAGLTPNEFFNSAENLRDLVQKNGLLRNQEDLLLYRKALGHSIKLDCSIIYDTSKRILNPLGRPVRRTQVSPSVKRVWNRMNRIIIRGDAPALSGSGRGADRGRGGEPGCHLAVDLAGCTQHPLAAQPFSA